MSNKLTKLFFLLIALVAIQGLVEAKVPRRVLMEDHTGAWCGWCVLGNQAMEDILEEFQDRFIPVALHNGDAMAISSLQGSIASAMGVTGYPSGTMNRMKINLNGSMTVAHHPSYWEQTVPEHITDMSGVDVEVTYTLNKQTMELTATVKATVLEDIPGQLAFNLYVMHDDMTGTGTGWDQTNYLSGRAGYEDNPYYNEPNKIANFKHQNVMIKMLGGAFGTNGIFPATGAKAGETYEHTFTTNLLNNTPAVQNVEKLWFVGLVQQTGAKYEILNSEAVNKVYPRPNYRVRPANVDNYKITPRGETTTIPVVLNNYSSERLKGSIVLDASNSTYPTDWNIQIENTKIEIEPGSTLTMNLNVIAGATKGFGYFNFIITPTATNDYDASQTYVSISALSDGFKYVIWSQGDRTTPFLQSFNQISSVASNSVMLPTNPNSIAAFGAYGFDMAIIPETFDSRGLLFNNTELLTHLNDLITAKKPILITSNLSAWFSAGNYSSGGYVPDQLTMNFYNSLGIKGISQSMPMSAGNSQQGSLYLIDINGNSDEISKDYVATLNKYNQTTFPYYTFYLDPLKVVNTDIATPILTFSSTQTTVPTDNTAAVKINTAAGSRAIYCGFSFDLIDDVAKRTTLMGNMINWLLGETSVDIENTNTAGINIYPNPMQINGTISLNVPETLNNSDVYIIDVNGNKVMDLNMFQLTPGLNNVSFVNTLSAGSYYIIANINDVYSYYPFVVE
jgi:hypothetical protein